MKPAYRNLKAARELINQHGWIQGMGGDKYIGFCMVGALANASRQFVKEDGHASIYLVKQSLSDTNTPYNKAMMALKRAIGTTDVVSYNDGNAKSKEEIINAFTKAMRLAR